MDGVLFGCLHFWDAYGLTFGLAAVSTLVTSLVAFPCAYALAFKVSDSVRRWAIFFLIIPFFTSYLVRIYAWQVIIAEHGVINAALGLLGLDPFIMLNTRVGTLIGYLTLCLSSTARSHGGRHVTEALVVFDKVVKRFGDFTAVQALTASWSPEHVHILPGD